MFKRSLIVVAFLSVFLAGGKVAAICRPGIPVNPVTDLCWQCIFPLRISGIKVVPGSHINDYPDAARKPVCICPFPPPIFFRIGIPLSFWEPARMVEVVKDPFCFPSLGFQLSATTGGLLGGSSSKQNVATTDRSTFFQAHYWIFPVWTAMEILIDFACLEHSGIDPQFTIKKSKKPR